MFSRFVSTSALVPLVLLVPTSGRAQESSDELIEKFIEKIAAGEFEEANRYVLSAQCEDNELHAELILMANALLQRREAMQEEAGKLVGKEIALDTKAGKKKGILEEVTEEEFVLKVQVKVGRQVVGESTARVKWADLTYEQEKRLSRTWEENKLALAVLWYSSGNAAKAESYLNGARGPLGERLLAEIRGGDATKPVEKVHAAGEPKAKPKAKKAAGRPDEDERGTRSRLAMTTFLLARLAAYKNMTLSRDIHLGKARTALNSSLVERDTTLTKGGSPYLISGFLTVEQAATLTVEPGVKLYFAPGAKLHNKGTLKMQGDGRWIILCPAQRDQRWNGVYSEGPVVASSCIVAGSDEGIFFKDPRGASTIDECVFSNNKSGLQARARDADVTVQNCLFMNNEAGLRATRGRGRIRVSQSLFIGNEFGLLSDYPSEVTVERSTFFRNTVGMRVRLYEHRVNVHDCNILGNVRNEVEIDADGVNLRGNFWGSETTAGFSRGQPEKINGKNVEYYDWLTAPVPDALPVFPRCPFLRL